MSLNYESSTTTIQHYSTTLYLQSKNKQYCLCTTILNGASTWKLYCNINFHLKIICNRESISRAKGAPPNPSVILHWDFLQIKTK